MDNTNDLISKSPVHLTSNTIILIAVALITFYILLKAIGKMVKIIALVFFCWFALMTFQSTNIVDIPLVKQTYTELDKRIPSKALWTEAVKSADKINIE